MLGYKGIGPATIDVGALAERIYSTPAIHQSLAEVDLGDVYSFLFQYLGQAGDLGAWLSDAQINRDRSLRLQYLAGLSVDNFDTYDIFMSIAAHRRYPDNVFIVPPEMEFNLRSGFGF